MTAVHGPGAALTALHHGPRPLVLPNAWDVASALLLQEAGFRAIGTTSLGVTAAAGLPDGSGAGRDLTLGLAVALADRLRVLLTVDVERGYSGDPARVADLAVELEGLGVAGVNLEDGLHDGTLRPTSHHAEVLAAVVSAAPTLFVNARTDVHWLAVGDPAGRTDEALRRVVAYRDAGADGVFVPGLTDLGETAAVADAAGVPLNVLWREGPTLDDLSAAGVARVSTGSTLYRHALAAAVRTARLAREDAPGDAEGPIDYAVLQQLLRTP